jgi:hypothetical protein
MANTTINNGTVNTVVEEEVIMNTLTQKDIDAMANGETVVVEDMEEVDMGTMTQEDINEVAQEVKEEKDMAEVKLTQVLKGKVEEIREDLANGGSDMFNEIKEGLDDDAKTIASAFGMATQSLSKVFDGGEISLFLHEYINTIRNNGIAGVFSGEKVLVDRIYKLGEKYVANGKIDKLEDAMAFECGDNTQGVIGSLASLVAWTLIHAKSTAKKLFGGVVEDNEIIKKLVDGASAIIGVVKAGISIVFNIGVRVITFATAVVTKAVTMLWDAVKYLYNKIKTYIESKKSNNEVIA